MYFSKSTTKSSLIPVTGKKILFSHHLTVYTIEYIYLFINGETSATKIHQKLFQVYQQKTIDRSNVMRWIQRFQKGDFNLNDKQRQCAHQKMKQLLTK